MSTENVVGIISEYNPFHGGHSYHIRKAKELAGAKYAVVIMNGDFVQRGEPAVYDKYTRATQALDGGADLVFELPVRFGLSSAGDFSLGGVLALESLGFVTHLCFGSECGDLAPLTEAAHSLAKETAEFREALGDFLRRGFSFPDARARALTQTADIDPELLAQPNNILGIEYCLAIEKTHSSLVPLTIRRLGQGYLESAENPEGFPSSTALRRKIYTEDTPHLCLEDFDNAVGYALLQERDLSRYKDISSDLAARIRDRLPGYHGITDFVSACQTRTFTESRIRRGLFQCLLGIRETLAAMPYLRFLGGKKEACCLLRQTNLTILSRLAVDMAALSERDRELLNTDILASELYRQTFCIKYGDTLANEYQRSPVIVDSYAGPPL